MTESPPPRPRPAWHIAAISGGTLVLELSLIRLIPAEVRVISYFTNLLLLAAFFGLGLGCILQRQRSLGWLFPAGLGLVFAFVWLGRGILVYSESEAVHYWLQYEELAGQAFHLPLAPAAIAAFAFAALPFVALGQSLARAMDAYPRLIAYGWDIAGSLGGTLLFAASSALSLPPWLWPPLVALGFAWGFATSHAQRLACAAAGLAFAGLAHSPHPWHWSPYYYVQYAEEAAGLRVWVNSSFHQFAVDFSDPRFRPVQQQMLEKWGVPYRTYRELNQGRAPRSVLVLGAGTGNDVVVALANGAERVVAVEIDPQILRLGRERNGAKPYADPRVHTVVDDARHYLHTAQERFDLVVLATLDSQSLLSGHANLRLENYVYTAESLADAKRLLTERGLVACYYSVFKPWLYERLYATMRAAFGDQMRIHTYPTEMLFNTVLMGAATERGFEDSPAHVARFGGGIPATDDWPFVYLERPTVAGIYVQIFAVVGVLVAGAFVLLRRLHPARGLHVNFFLLGLAFTLLQSSAIVRFALLFGSTWTVNAVVFASTLSMIFLANWAVLQGRAPSLRMAWPALLLGIAANWALPLSAVLELSAPLRALASALLIGTPVFFAAVCFSRLFARERVTGYPLGLNLVGAMGGGLVEYVSMLLGMRAVWLVILAVYALAWASSAWIARRT